MPKNNNYIPEDVRTGDNFSRVTYTRREESLCGLELGWASVRVMLTNAHRKQWLVTSVIHAVHSYNSTTHTCTYIFQLELLPRPKS